MAFGPGNCFGEWAIIYNQPRSASAYIAENTHLISIEADKFEEFLSKSVIKSEVDRKNFIRNKIASLANLNNFDEYYKRIIPTVSYFY